MKVSIIGAGNVGASLAFKLLQSELTDVALIDVAKGIAKGKALDLSDAAFASGCDIDITGSEDFRDLKGSDIVVVTAGLSRKPGMTRDDLLNKNASIVKSITTEIKRYAKNAVIVVVTNPVDAMAMVVYRSGGFNPRRVFGMGGVLDSARFGRAIVDALKISVKDVEPFVIGQHGDMMIPLIEDSFVFSDTVGKALKKNKLELIKKKTVSRGAEIVGLLGSGSAFYAPAVSTYLMIESIIKDRKSLFPVSAYLNGEYGIRDVYIGVPARLGRDGIVEILEFDLTSDEKRLLKESAAHLKELARRL